MHDISSNTVLKSQYSQNHFVVDYSWDWLSSGEMSKWFNPTAV